MKNLFAHCLLVAGIALAAASPVAEASAVSDARAMFDKALAAFNARDYTAYEAFFTDDVEAYTGVYTPFRFIGKAKWIAFIRGLDAYASVTYEQRHPECRSYNDDTVLCNGYFVFSTVSKSGGVTVQSGRESTTMVKIKGKWLIANYHFSAMF
jgi:ketosteroid isomerase-like protein